MTRFLQKMRQWAPIAISAFGFLVVLCALLVAQPAWADDQRGTDGVYQIQAKIMHASQAGQQSLAAAAFDNVLEPGTAQSVTEAYNKEYAENSKQGKTTSVPSYTLTLVIKDGVAYLETRVVPIDRSLGSVSLTGYLGFLNYYPDYHGTSSPSSETSTAALVDSYYTTGKNLTNGGYDSYNRTKTGTDAALRGMLYPENVSLRIDTAYAEQWIQVYVPVMESINKGSGSQYAKIELDYDSMVKVTDADEVETAEEIAEHHASATQNGYQDLANEITTASKVLLETDTYTQSSLSNLRTVRDRVQSIYTARTANSFQVMKAIVDLSVAEAQLEKKGANAGSSDDNSSGSSSGTSNAPSSSSNVKETSSQLDFAHLPDGTYTVYGEMIKTDRQQQSMADKAVNHSIRIIVKNGHYTVRMTFSAMNYSGQTGALGKLWYYKNGYQHADGTISGKRAQAKVLSYLTTSSGAKYQDAYGTNYPKTVSFPLITKAKSDGWVPLQVYVPLMESISAGSSKQNVYLKIHTDTVVSGAKKVTGSSEATSSASASSSDQDTSSDDGESDGALPSGDDEDSDEGTLAQTSDSDSDTEDADDKTAAAVGADESGDSGSDDSSQESDASNDSQSDASTGDATSEPQPPMKRYLGLMGGGTATAVFAGLGYALIRRRALIAALIGVAH